jgi:Flp pilus assembly protein TadD
MPSRRIGPIFVLCVAGICGQFARGESQIDGAASAFASGDYSRAIKILNRAASENPRDAALQHLLARCYFESEQYDRAIPPAEASISLEQKSAQGI